MQVVQEATERIPRCLRRLYVAIALSSLQRKNPEHEQQTIELMERNIINFACKADYREGETLYNTVKAILQHIKALDNYYALERTNINEANKMYLEKDIACKQGQCHYHRAGQDVGL